MPNDDKPELSLLPGSRMFNLDDVALFFEKLTGRKPTPEEMKEAELYLKDHKPAP